MSGTLNLDFPLKELVFALKGYPGDIFSEVTANDSRDNLELQLKVVGNSLRSYFHPSEIEMVDTFLLLATDYRTISSYITQDNVMGKNISVYESRAFRNVSFS